MKRDRQLPLLVRVVHQRALNAQQTAIRAQDVLRKSREQLEQLLEYRREYSARFLSDGSAGIGATEMSTFREFLARVDQAITQQQLAIREQHTVWNGHHEQWETIHKREQALGKLVQRKTREAQMQQHSREQKDSDESGQLKASRRR